MKGGKISMSYVEALECKKCKERYPASKMRYFCDNCGDFLQVIYKSEKMRQDLDRDKISQRSADIMSKWIEFLPIEDPSLIKRVSLGEMETPLIESRRFGERLPVRKLYLKNESVFPTLSLKDRSIPLTILKGIELNQGFPSIVSSGNAGASLAAYATHAGEKGIVFAGKNAKGPRLLQMLMTGALVILVNSDYSTVESLFSKAREKFGWYDCNGQVNPFRLEGKRIYAHEICMQLGWKVPSAILMPVAGGNGIIAIEKGFRELKEMGWIDQIPKIYGVQAEECAPIAKAFEEGLEEVKPITPNNTIAGSIAVANPGIGGNLTLAAVRSTSGGVVAVSEQDILRVQKELAGLEGLYCEPAGSISVAGLEILCKKGDITRNDTVVCLLTAHGLKQPGSIEDATGLLFEVEPSLKSISDAIKDSGVLLKE